MATRNSTHSQIIHFSNRALQQWHKQQSIECILAEQSQLNDISITRIAKCFQWMLHSICFSSSCLLPLFVDRFFSLHRMKINFMKRKIGIINELGTQANRKILMDKNTSKKGKIRFLWRTKTFNNCVVLVQSSRNALMYTFILVYEMNLQFPTQHGVFMGFHHNSNGNETKTLCVPCYTRPFFLLQIKVRFIIP